MSDTTAKIRAKGCQSTGITEELARKYHDNIGTHVMAVVELKAVRKIDDDDGKEVVELVIQTIEPAEAPEVSNHLRNLSRAMYHERKLTGEDDQPKLDGIDDVEPTVAGVMAARGYEQTDDGWEYPEPEGQQEELPEQQEDPVPAQ